MINKKRMVVLLLITLIKTLNASPVPSEELYRGPDIYSYKLNPGETLLVGYVAKKKQGVLQLLDLKLETTQELIGFEWNKFAFLKEFYWIDKNTLYIKYKENASKETEAFLDLEVTKTNKLKLKPKLRKIKARGTIISALRVIDNKVLFQRKTGSNPDDINVYYADTENLVENDFFRRDKFKRPLDKAFLYFPDSKNQIRLAATIERKDILFWYLDEKRDKWIEFYKINSFDYDFSPVGFLGLGKLAVITNKESNLNSLYEFDIHTKQLGKLLFQHPKYDLTSAKINNKTRTVEYVQYFDHGQLTTHYFSKENSKISRLLKEAFPGKQRYMVSGSENSEYKVINVFASNDPGKLYLFNQRTRIAKLIGPLYQNIDKYEMLPSEVFSVGAGKKIEAILSRPGSNNNGVLLVMPHGGPIGVRDYDFFNPEVQYFVSRGFTVLNVNFSGSTGYGKTFLKSGKGQFGKKIEQDITAAVNHVRKKYKFSKMCSIGSSYGGYSAMMLAIYNPNDYQCAIASYGVFDLPLLFNESNLQRQKDNIKSVIATVGEYDESLKEYSPFYLAEKITSKILLIAGKEDKTASFEQTNRMKYRLNQLGVDLETMFYDGVGHGHSSWKGNRHELAVINDFLMRKLNLSPPKDKGYQKILSEEYMRFSDSFNFDDFVKNDFNQALEYNKKAAGLGHPRGMFNLGSYYHQGKIVEKNIEKAVAWYEKSAKAGYGGASYRLGNLYRIGDEIKASREKANKYYKLASEQGNKRSKLEVESKSCFTIEKTFNIDKCIDALSTAYKDKDKDNRNRVWSLLTEFVWDSGRSKQAKDKLNKMLNKNYHINVTDKIEADVDDYGLMIKTNETRQKVEVNETKNKIVIGKGRIFGISYELNTNSSQEKPKAIIKVKWTHPAITNPKTGITTTKIQHLERSSLYGRTYWKTNYSWFQFDAEWEMVPGDWEIELSTIDGKLLYEHTFELIKPNN